MIHIVKSSCQIERDEYCKTDVFVEKPAAMSAVIVYSAVHVECFGPKAMLIRVERNVCQYFFQRTGRWAQ